MLCRCSRNALKTSDFFRRTVSDHLVTTQQSQSPVASGGATCLHFAVCFLFGRERQNWAFSQLEMKGGGAVWCRLRAGNDGSCSFNERQKRKTKTRKKTKKETDAGQPAASSTPVQSCVEKHGVMNCFSPQIKWWRLYSYVSYHRESSQLWRCPLPRKSQAFLLEFNSYHK